jgi:hypothetical protein
VPGTKNAHKILKLHKKFAWGRRCLLVKYAPKHRAYPLHRGEMDQLQGFRSDGHTLHTKLLRLDASFIVPPRAATSSLRNRRHRVLTPKLKKTRDP